MYKSGFWGNSVHQQRGMYFHIQMCRSLMLCMLIPDDSLGFPINNSRVFSPCTVVPYWLWIGKEVQRQPNTTAHPLQRRQEPDRHSTLCLHQCTPGHWTKVCTSVRLITLEDKERFTIPAVCIAFHSPCLYLVLSCVLVQSLRQDVISVFISFSLVPPLQF